MKAALLIVALAFSGCALAIMDKTPACVNDSDCPGSQVCFADGCQNPLRDVVVQITPNPNGGGQPQDFQLLTLEANQPLVISAQAALNGSVLQPNSTGVPSPYVLPVTFSVTGGSELIPNQLRSFTSTLPLTTSAGEYSMAMPTGLYNVVVTGQDPGIPPQVFDGLEVTPGLQLQEAVQFPAYGDPTLLHVTGGLSYPSTQTSGFVAQAFDATTGDPLSQSVPATAAAGFNLVLNSSVRTASSFDITFTPVDPTIAPSQTFVVPVVDGGLEPLDGGQGLQFAMGDYGAPFQITGTVQDTSGTPIIGAAVFIQGTVVGGGTFSSPAAATGTSGSFTLQTLPPSVGDSGGLFVTVIPPPQSTAAGQTYPVSPTPTASDLGTFTCMQRTLVSGTVVNPDGGPSAGTTIVANVVEAAPMAVLNSTPPRTTTDVNGAFSLPLDLALYRLDFTPGDTSLPNKSDALDVRAPSIANTTGLQFELSNGSRIGGSVTGPTSLADPTQVPVPNAVIRFFHVTQVGASQTDLVVTPLGTADTDQSGNYSVIIPTR